jgi:hypothetical protein
MIPNPENHAGEYPRWGLSAAAATGRARAWMRWWQTAAARADIDVLRVRNQKWPYHGQTIRKLNNMSVDASLRAR